MIVFFSILYIYTRQNSKSRIKIYVPKPDLKPRPRQIETSTDLLRYGETRKLWIYVKWTYNVGP